MLLHSPKTIVQLRYWVPLENHPSDSKEIRFRQIYHRRTQISKLNLDKPFYRLGKCRDMERLEKQKRKRHGQVLWVNGRTRLIESFKTKKKVQKQKGPTTVLNGGITLINKFDLCISINKAESIFRQRFLTFWLNIIEKYQNYSSI